MKKIERQGTETLTIQNCPCCNGEIEVSECGYSSFNPGTAKCVGKCKRKWDLGYVNNEWDCGERWNELSREIKRKLKAFKLLEVNNTLASSRDFEREALAEEAELLLKELEEQIIDAS